MYTTAITLLILFLSIFSVAEAFMSCFRSLIDVKTILDRGHSRKCRNGCWVKKLLQWM